MRKLVCAVLVAACSSSPKPPMESAPPVVHNDVPATPATPTVPAPAATEKVMTADTPWTDTDGNTFIVAAGWKVARTTR